MNATPPSTSPKTRNNRRRPRRWLPALFVLGIIGLIIAGLWPRPVPVETMRVTTGSLRTSINEEGKTRIRQRYVVSAPVAGLLRRISAKAGMNLEDPQVVIAIIDPLPPALLDARTFMLAGARRDTSMAQLERARAGHKFAASELRRGETLRSDNTISVQDLEQIQWRETAAARELAAAQSALREAEAALAEFAAADPSRPPVELKSPIAGRVLRVFEENSRVVPAGTPLLEIGDPDDLEVVIEVLSRDGAIIQPGTPVELEQWGGPQPLQARVRMVEPAAFTKVSALGVEEQRVNVIAELLTAPAERGNLGDNFRVEARIITWQTSATLKASSGALFRNGEQWRAYVIVNGRARIRAIQVGHSSGPEREILGGLQEGEQIIIYPSDRIRAGLRVTPVKI